jgi:hypothetical protein
MRKHIVTMLRSIAKQHPISTFVLDYSIITVFFIPMLSIIYDAGKANIGKAIKYIDMIKFIRRNEAEYFSVNRDVIGTNVP